MCRPPTLTLRLQKRGDLWPRPSQRRHPRQQPGGAAGPGGLAGVRTSYERALLIFEKFLPPGPTRGSTLALFALLKPEQALGHRERFRPRFGFENLAPETLRIWGGLTGSDQSA